MAFDYDGARTAIDTHLTAAGTAVTPVIKNVGRGAPVVVTEPLIRSWYLGDTPSELLPDTMTDATGAERVAIGAYIPITDAQTAVAADGRLRALAAEIRHRLLGSGKLGGKVTELTLDDFTVEYIEAQGGWVAALLTTADLHYTDVDDLS